MKIPDPKPRRVKTSGYNTVTVKGCYTREQMQQCWDASRKEALEEVIYSAEPWAELRARIISEVESLN